MSWSISELRVRLACHETGLSSPLKILLTFPRRYFLCESFVLFMSYVCHAFASVHCCLEVTCWEWADLMALVCDVYCDFVTFQFGILGQVWYLIVLIPDPSCLSYFNIPINSYCPVHVPVYWYPEWKDLNGMIWKESIFNLTYQAFSYECVPEK